MSQKKLRYISEINSRNILNAIVPAYCQPPYAHFGQKRGCSDLVLLQNFPVGFIFKNHPVLLDFTSHVMYYRHDEIIFGVGHKLQKRTGNNTVENDKKPPIQEPSCYKIQCRFHNG